ncbi:MAG: hypothetical protein mread185_000677 [Mycoplasmataceae bacterium]|nr:MAG: hypothetical protein mread185_000677 [Mycoplasmataceae bacterium]
MGKPKIKNNQKNNSAINYEILHQSLGLTSIRSWKFFFSPSFSWNFKR